MNTSDTASIVQNEEQELDTISVVSSSSSSEKENIMLQSTDPHVPASNLRHTINVFLLITQIGFLCVYMLFLTDNIRYFFNSFFPNYPLNFYAVGFIVTLALIPLCLCENMRMLVHLSTVANVATLIGTVLIFAFLFSPEVELHTTFSDNVNWRSLLIGFSIAMCSFEGISLVLPIENKMAHPEAYIHPFGVLNVGMTMIIGVNTAIAFFGYLKVGDEAQGSITLNIHERPYWTAPIKPLFIVAISVSYLLQYYVPAVIFARLMEKLRCHREATERRRSINLKVMRISIVLFTYGMVIIIPKLDLMISLIGSFASSILAFVMPPLLELVHLWPTRSQIPHFYLTVVAKHSLFILLGLITFVGGTSATLIQLANAFGPSMTPK